MMLTHLLLYKSSTVGDTQHSVLIFTLSLDNITPISSVQSEEVTYLRSHKSERGSLNAKPVPRSERNCETRVLKRFSACWSQTSVSPPCPGTLGFFLFLFTLRSSIDS